MAKTNTSIKMPKVVAFSLTKKSRFMPVEVKKFDLIDSTNNALKKHLGSGKKDLIFMADHQTAGKGQYDRKWVSAKGKSLLVSVPISWPAKKANQANIPAFVGLALHQTLAELNIKSVKIKLPNDIIVGKKKLAGILCERTVLAGSSLKVNNKIIAGIGVNLTQEVFEKDLTKTATSIKQLTGLNITALNLLADLYKNLDKTLKKIEQNQETMLWQKIKSRLTTNIHNSSQA